MLTCALALVGCANDADPEPAPDGGTGSSDDAGASTDADASGVTGADVPVTTIPDDFPLSAGMGGPGDTIPTTRTGTGLRDLMLCDTAPMRGLGVRDRMTADNSGGESADTRELVLLGSPDEAAQVAGSFSDLSLDCDATTVRGDTEIATEVRETPLGPPPAATILQTYTFDGEPGSGATIIHVVPVGSALLVTSTFYGWSDDALEQGLAETVEAVRPAVDAMAAFDDGAASTPSSTPTPESAPSGPAGVSEDLPLAVGLPEGDSGSARLVLSTYGEGSLASLDQQADRVTGTTEKIVPAMCVFTNTGC
ncbi:hypothetical protein CXG46_03340 [Nocardioides alpinus]|uniref:PknH-like extracellular domain-containing protein n=1 Tax=Nocardioides alpinus TaxID=748909 RepID=A0ABX4R0Q1_9ACTN|nr:hypothetical protein CXG46_03340 [Nocardioides alpinus]